MGNQFDPATSDTLYQETEGNPLFVVEMVQAGTVSTQPATQGPLSLLTRATSSLPPSVQAILATRLAQLSAQAHSVANVAAVIGREFSFSVLVHASGEYEEQVVQGLDELWQRRMVREHDEGATNTYDFSHDKLREQIYVALRPAHRRLLHQRIAEAFQSIYREDLDAICGQIAVHYEQAGLPAQAVSLYQRAGRIASQIYAHAEALHAFERAAALLQAHQSGQTPWGVPWETAAQVYVSLGDVSAAMSSFEDARLAYHRAMACIPEEAYLWQARLHWKIGTTWMYASPQSHASHSLQEFEEAERILTQRTDLSSPDWRDEWIALQFAHIWRGSVGDMAVALEKVRLIIEQHGTPEQRKLFIQALGMYNAIRDHYVIPAERLFAWRATIAEMGPPENEAQRGMDLAVLGIGLLCASQFDEAEEQLRHALRLGERTGNAWVQNNCLTFLPFIFRPRGQVEEMRRILVQAQSLGIGQNSHILLGHHAWVAWRDGNLTLAETYGRASVEEERSPHIRLNMFLWAGRWPLIGVALAQAQTLVAINEVRLLFDSTQQPPREPLDALLVAALQAWDAGGQEEARALLQQAVPLAEQMGYL
jgi:tetratricopeptide (TPR) repeat protein